MESRKWIHDPSKQSEEYIRGVNEFLELTFQNSQGSEKIWCPCTNCANCKSLPRTSVYEINRRNRAKFEDVHCMGTKSLPRLIDEKKKLGKGVLPSRKEIYIHTRTRKDGTIINQKAARVIEEQKKYDDAETSQSTQNTQSHTSWKEDILSKVQGLDKRGRVRCMGKIPKCKKSKVFLAENEELRDRMKNMEKLLTSVLALIQTRLPGEDLNGIMDAARLVSDAASAPDNLNSPSFDANEDDEYDENGED